MSGPAASIQNIHKNYKFFECNVLYLPMYCNDKDTTIGPRRVFVGDFDAVKIFTILFTFDTIFHCFVDKWGVFWGFRKSGWKFKKKSKFYKNMKNAFHQNPMPSLLKLVPILVPNMFIWWYLTFRHKKFVLKILILIFFENVMIF